jgi:hypothetical protein
MKRLLKLRQSSKRQQVDETLYANPAGKLPKLKVIISHRRYNRGRLLFHFAKLVEPLSKKSWQR